MLYRIVTNAKYRADIVNLVGDTFTTFTVLEGAYYTKGSKQYAMVVEIDAPEAREKDVRKLSGAITELIGSNHRTESYALAHKTLEPISIEDAKAEEADRLREVRAKLDENEVPEDIDPSRVEETEEGTYIHPEGESDN